MKISNHLTSATLSFVILTASAFLPASAQSGPTPQEQMACRSDAGKFCAEHVGKPPQQTPVLSEPLRQAYASTAPSDIGAPNITAAPAAPPKPKAVNKPAVQKNYALLSDVQIAGIKERLKLSPDQESYWPGVEKALRAIARKIHSTRQADPAAGTPPIDPDAEEVQQLKSAAMPLLFQLREDQKREVRSLARIIGLEKVASMI